MRNSMILALLLATALPAQAHDWFYGLTVPGSKQSCCNMQDCRPVPDCSSPGAEHRGVVIDGRCIEVPPSRILDLYSPDDQAYACWSQNMTPVSIRCAIFPGQST